MNAIQSRIEKAEMQRAGEIFGSVSPLERLDIVAQHYCRMASTCQQIHKLIEEARYTKNENVSVIIARLNQIFSNDYVRTFGAEPPTMNPKEQTEQKKESPKRRLYRVNGCQYCDEHKGDTMMPWHDASDHCESGKQPHCSCDSCY